MWYTGSLFEIFCQSVEMIPEFLLKQKAMRSCHSVLLGKGVVITYDKSLSYLFLVAYCFYSIAAMTR